MMNPEYQKGKWRKVTTWKKKDPANKTVPSKKASATRTESNAETENKRKPSLEINYDVLDKLFDAGNSPKRAKLNKPVVGDQMEYSKQSSEESLLKPQGSEEEEPDWNEDYSKEDAYRGDENYGNEDIEFEDLDEEEDDEGIIW